MGDIGNGISVVLPTYMGRPAWYWRHRARGACILARAARRDGDEEEFHLMVKAARTFHKWALVAGRGRAVRWSDAPSIMLKWKDREPK